MKNIFTKSIIAASFLALSGAANAELVHIDFDDFEAGTTITNQIDGVFISLLGAEEGHGPRIYDISDTAYAPATGMALRPSGNMNGRFGRNGGPWFDLVFEFDAPTDYFSILSLDSDEPVSAFAYLGDDLVDATSFDRGSNHQVWNLELGEFGGGHVFDRVIVDIVTTGKGYEPGPEFFDNLTFNRRAVPTPGALTLLATSGIIAMRRRRTET